MPHKTPKKPIASWKIWLGIFLAILVGAGTGIAILLLSKALVLLTSVLAWLAPFFVMALIGAVLLAQIAAVLALFTMDLDPITHKSLLWIGVYSLPLSGAGLTLLLAYTAFGAIALSPLFWASFIGLVFGLIVGGYIHYKIKKLSADLSYKKLDQDSSTPPTGTQPAAELKSPDPKLATVKPLQKDLTVRDYTDYITRENKLQDLRKYSSKEDMLMENNELRLKGSSLVYFAVTLQANGEQRIAAASDFFKEGVSAETLQALKNEQKKLLTKLESTNIVLSDLEYLTKSKAKLIEEAALKYLGEKLEEALQLKLTPNLLL